MRKPKTAARLVAVPLSLALVAISWTAAGASEVTATSLHQDDSSVTGGDVYTGPVPEMTAAEAKHRAELFAKYMARTGTKLYTNAEITALASKLGISSQLSTARAQLDSGAPASRAAGDVTTAAVGSSLLNITQVPQSKGYYCGPAVGVEMIKAPLWDGMKSKADGSSISQSAMANSKHMKTEDYDVTSWASRNFVNGINAWTGKTKNTYYQYTAPTAAEVTVAITESLTAGIPVAADTVEFAGGLHYNGHPDRKIGHWIVAYYFEGSGAYTSWVDSTANSSAVTGFGNAQPKFKYATASFATRFLKTNGIAY